MEVQRKKNWLWIIRTDPVLVDSVKTALLQAVQQTVLREHIVVLATPNNPDTIRKTDSDSVLWHGDQALWDAYQQQAQQKAVMETRLDVDEGLPLDFIEILQRQAPSRLPEPTDWAVWCIMRQSEWHVSNESRRDLTYGSFHTVRDTACMKSGLTFAYGTTTSNKDLPVPRASAHQHLYKSVPLCHPTLRHCLEVLYQKSPRRRPGALKARTPASTGVTHLQWPRFGVDNSNGNDMALPDGWEDLQRWFGLNPEQLRDIRTYLIHHAAAVAKDNIQSQCRGDNRSCKPEVEYMLRSLARRKNPTQ